MNKTGKRLSVAAAALIVVLLAALGAFAALMVGISAGNMHTGSETSEVSIYDFDGTPVAAEEAARIVEADAKYPLGAKIETYDNDGSRIALDDVDPSEYAGFMASVNVDNEAAQAKMRSALDSGSVNYVTDDIVSAASLDVLAQFFSEEDLGSVGPDYVIHPYEGEAPEAGTAEAAADGATESGTGTEYTQDDLTLIKAKNAWDAGLTGKGVKIAVIDMGLKGTGNGDEKHEDIDYSKVLPGLDCTEGQPTSGTAYTPDVSNRGHGTFVAGEIIATYDNGLGVNGIAHGASIIPYKVFYEVAGSDPRGQGSYVIKAVKSAISAGADVITMSLGDTHASQFDEAAFEEAAENGVIIIAACGNDGNAVPHYPAAFDSVIGVSAVDNTGAFASVSDYGKENVYVSAPGVGIHGLGVTSSDSYTTMSGTSMSAPQVAAFAALAVQKFRESENPIELNQPTFKQLLKEMVQGEGRDSGTKYDEYLGWGIIDCSRLVSYGGETNVLLDCGTVGGADWRITKDGGELIISPTNGTSGSLDLNIGSDSGRAPWNGNSYPYKDAIKRVTVGAGVSAGSSLQCAFRDLSSCESINLASMTAGNATVTRYMFGGCSLLTNVVLPTSGIGSEATPVESTYGMFSGCSSLRNLDLSSLQLKSSFTNNYMFSNCAFKSIVLPESWPSDRAITIPAVNEGTDSEGHSYNGKWLASSGTEVANPTAPGEYTASVTHPAKVETTPATCTTAGATKEICTVCGKVIKTTEIPIDVDAHKLADVSEDGWAWADDYVSATATRVCELNSSHTVSKTVASEHVQHDGKTTYTAKVVFDDGKSYETTKTVEGDPVPHTHVWDAGVVTSEPTCTKVGVKTFTCTECKLNKTEEIPTVAHNMVEVEGSAKAPTCTEDGVTASKACSFGCGTTEAGTAVKALGHDFKAVVTTEPTCEEAGEQHEVCERCDAVKEGSEKEVPALGHEWGDPEWKWNDAKDAAEATFVCTRDKAHTDTVKADVTSEWADNNVIERTAAVEHDGKEFTDTQKIEDASLKSVEINSEAVDAGFDAMISGIPADSKVELNVDPVSEGEVHDAIVEKAAGNAMTVLAGIYDINLKIDGKEKDSDFGELTLIFPVSEQFNGKAVTIHHCHGDDPANIESTDGYVVEDGKVVVKGVTKLSTFGVEVDTSGTTAVSSAAPAEPNNAALGSGFAATGDQMPIVMVVLAVVAVVAIVVALCILIPMRRSKK